MVSLAAQAAVAPDLKDKDYAMTGEEQELLEQYLTHLNILGEEGTHPNFDAWYPEVRYTQGPNAPQTLEQASELRFKAVLEAAQVFKHQQDTNSH